MSTDHVGVLRSVNGNLPHVLSKSDAHRKAQNTSSWNSKIPQRKSCSKKLIVFTVHQFSSLEHLALDLLHLKLIFWTSIWKLSFRDFKSFLTGPPTVQLCSWVVISLERPTSISGSFQHLEWSQEYLFSSSTELLSFKWQQQNLPLGPCSFLLENSASSMLFHHSSPCYNFQWQKKCSEN